jgi:hypothetical protein
MAPIGEITGQRDKRNNYKVRPEDGGRTVILAGSFRQTYNTGDKIDYTITNELDYVDVAEFYSKLHGNAPELRQLPQDLKVRSSIPQRIGLEDLEGMNISLAAVNIETGDVLVLGKSVNPRFLQNTSYLTKLGDEDYVLTSTEKLGVKVTQRNYPEQLSRTLNIDPRKVIECSNTLGRESLLKFALAVSGNSYRNELIRLLEREEIHVRRNLEEI